MSIGQVLAAAGAIVAALATAIVTLWRQHTKLQEKRHAEYKEIVKAMADVLDRNSSALQQHASAFEQLVERIDHCPQNLTALRGGR